MTIFNYRARGKAMNELDCIYLTLFSHMVNSTQDSVVDVGKGTLVFTLTVIVMVLLRILYILS